MAYWILAFCSIFIGIDNGGRAKLEGVRILSNDERAAPSVVSFSKDGKLLAVGYKNGSIQVFDAANWRKRVKLIGDGNATFKLVFSEDGRTLASSCSLEDRVILWETATWQMRHTERFAGMVDFIALSCDGRLLAVSTRTGPPPYLMPNERLPEGREWRKAFIRDLTGSGKTSRPDTRGMEAGALAFSRDGTILAIASHEDAALILVDRMTGKKVSTTHVKASSAVNSLVYSPDGRVLLSLGDALIVYKADNGQVICSSLKAPCAAPKDLLLTIGKYAVSAGRDCTRLWRLQPVKLLDLVYKGGPVRSAVLSPDGATAAAAAQDGVRIYKITQSKAADDSSVPKR